MSNQIPNLEKMQNYLFLFIIGLIVAFSFTAVAIYGEIKFRNLEFKYSFLQSLIGKEYSPLSITETIIKTPLRLIDEYLQGEMYLYFYKFVGVGGEYQIGEYIYHLNNHSLDPKKKLLLSSSFSRAVEKTPPDLLAEIVLKAIHREIINSTYNPSDYVIADKPFQYCKEVKDYLVKIVLRQGNASSTAIIFLETLDLKLDRWRASDELNGQQRTLISAEQIKIHKLFNRLSV